MERDVLERLRQVSPLKFETLVLDLLHAMGYGLNRESLRRVGGSGDGGIDGIVPLDRLGRNKVYVQAKRWQGSLGSPEVQTFMGALQLHGADRGVLMTSGEFSQPAVENFASAKGALSKLTGRKGPDRWWNLKLEQSSESGRHPPLVQDSLKCSH